MRWQEASPLGLSEGRPCKQVRTSSQGSLPEALKAAILSFNVLSSPKFKWETFLLSQKITIKVSIKQSNLYSSCLKPVVLKY